jgi:hypothetical protein
MKVYDNNGDEVGTVQFIRSSEAGSSERVVAAALPDESAEPDLVDVIGKMFSSDDIGGRHVDFLKPYP